MTSEITKTEKSALAAILGFMERYDLELSMNENRKGYKKTM